MAYTGKTFTIRIHNKDISQPIVYENAVNMFEWGTHFLCVVLDDGSSHKYPIHNIWRVVNDYGYSSRQGWIEQEKK